MSNAPEGWDESEMWIEEIHNILCPGGNEHVPGACEPTTKILEIFSRYLDKHDADLLAPIRRLADTWAKPFPNSDGTSKAFAARLHDIIDTTEQEKQ